MPTINGNVADYLSQIEKLTSTNLQILKTINDSFFTKKNHLFAEIDNTTYVIPSFISLENKINMLQENFENLIKAPETSEAYFNFNGNTRSIEVRKYSHVPDSIKLPAVTTYNVESNDIFKDFMTPVPYINLDLPYIPNDIVEVNVKKIIAKSDALKSLFKAKLTYTQELKDENGNVIMENGVAKTQTLQHASVNEAYGNIYKLLLNYTDDVDYVEYDTIYKLPTRKNIGTGTYVIESIVSDIVDDDLNELITLKLRNNLTDKTYTNKLTYKLFDDTIEKQLQVGDHLINFDGTGKVMITDVKPATNTITVKVVNGEYLNFLGTDSYDTDSDRDIHDMSKLRFYAAIDFDADKYVKVPLEEDQFVFVAVAAVNSRMNVQSSWGTGIVIDTFSLVNNDVKFNTYYNSNVKNIGDVLFEMTSMITAPITSLSQGTFDRLSSVKPNVTSDMLTVMQINKHLNNSTTVQNIRDAYNQKRNAEMQLNEVQTQINTVSDYLSSISFDDTNNTREIYTAQLTKLNNQKNELLTTINNAINTISLNANAAEIPIENAKYRIRGFYVPNIGVIDDIDTSKHVIGIQVQYRYKNVSTQLGNATSINAAEGNATYIYSDWNIMNSFTKSKIAKCVDGIYSYEYEKDNENINEPSYNQIDIPISQGETVDVRIKVLYDFGQPYVSMTSNWSDIVNIPFPVEYSQDVPILTIIEENNNDIETNRFNNILNTSGTNDHINDKVIDNNITYYHKPDHIASGFYTAERKIIPLSDKLLSMSNDIASLKSDILGNNSNCKVSLSIGDEHIDIYSDRENVITLESYNNFSASDTYNSQYNSGVGSWDLMPDESMDTHDGAYIFKNGVVSTMINISLANTGDSTLKLYPIFPGNRNVLLNNTASTFVNKNNYCKNYNEGVWFKYQYGSDVQTLQTQNQFITFRINDAWTGETYYSNTANVGTNGTQNSNSIQSVSGWNLGMIAYPYVTTKYGLCIDSDDARSYATINPGEEIIIPIYCAFVATTPNTMVEKTISFDIRTSLYSDPVNYSFKIVGKNTSSIQDKLTIANKRRLWDRLITPLKYRTTIK
jgi:hypothetical protein